MAHIKNKFEGSTHASGICLKETVSERKQSSRLTRQGERTTLTGRSPVSESIEG